MSASATTSPEGQPYDNSLTSAPSSPHIHMSECLKIDESHSAGVPSPFHTRTAMNPSTVTATVLSCFYKLDLWVQEHILFYVLVRDKATQPTIRPFYGCGLSPGYIRTGGHSYITNANIDLQIMLVSKSIRDKCSKIFYGGHTFEFHDPLACKWWMAHIGMTNLSHVQSMDIKISTGWAVDDVNSCSLDLSCEERWYQVLCWLQNKHHLDSFKIEFMGWHLFHFRSDITRHLTHWRLSIITKLKNIRGIRSPQLTETHGSYIGDDERNQIARCMCQPRASIPKRQPQAISLVKAMSMVKEIRERKEEEIRKRKEKEIRERKEEEITPLRDTKIKHSQAWAKRGSAVPNVRGYALPEVIRQALPGEIRCTKKSSPARANRNLGTYGTRRRKQIMTETDYAQLFADL